MLRGCNLTQDGWRDEHARLVAALQCDPKLRESFERAFAEARRAHDNGEVVDEQTVAGDENPASGDLPFGGSPSTAFLDDIARIWTPPERAPCDDTTLPVRGPPSSPTLPFSIPASVTLLKLEPYSALVAELRARPAEADSIMTKHGLSPEDRTSLHAAWKRRFETSVELLRQFEDLVTAKMKAKGEPR